MDREEIITRVQNNTGVDMDEVTTLVHNWIDYIQKDICQRRDWSWLKAYGYLSTEESYTTGTIAVSEGSTTVTGTDTVWTSAMAGWFIKLPDGNWYEVDEVASGTSLTVKIAYIGDTGTGETYILIKRDYALASDFKKMLYLARIVPSRLKITPIPETKMIDFNPNYFNESGEVNSYMFAGRNSDGNALIRYRPVQSSKKMFFYAYIKELPSIDVTGAESMMPSSMHNLFVFKLSEIIFGRVDLDNKSKDFKMFYEEALSKFIKEDMEMALDKTETYANERIARGYSIPTGKLDPDHYPIN